MSTSKYGRSTSATTRSLRSDPLGGLRYQWISCIDGRRHERWLGHAGTASSSALSHMAIPKANTGARRDDASSRAGKQSRSQAQIARSVNKLSDRRSYWRRLPRSNAISRANSKRS